MSINIKKNMIRGVLKSIFNDPFVFIKNIWSFRKELYKYRRWDWLYQMSMFRRGLELQIEYTIKNSYDDDILRGKKVEKMKRAVEIMKFHEDDLFISFAENELGYKYKYKYESNNSLKLSYEDKERNTAINKKSLELEDELWVELLDILDGQDLSQIKTEHEWIKKYDGSGIKWWIN